MKTLRFVVYIIALVTMSACSQLNQGDVQEEFYSTPKVVAHFKLVYEELAKCILYSSDKEALG